MIQMVFNAGGRVQVTPAGSGAFDVTIDGTEYTQAFNTNVATTIDDFIAAHAATILSNHGIFLVDGTTTLDLQNTKQKVVTSDTATVASEDFTLKTIVPMDDSSVTKASATSLTLTLNEAVAAALDVVTLTLADADTTLSEMTEIPYKLGVRGSRFTGSPYVYEVDHYATFA